MSSNRTSESTGSRVGFHAFGEENQKPRIINDRNNNNDDTSDEKSKRANEKLYSLIKKDSLPLSYPQNSRSHAGRNRRQIYKKLSLPVSLSKCLSQSLVSLSESLSQSLVSLSESLSQSLSLRVSLSESLSQSLSLRVSLSESLSQSLSPRVSLSESLSQSLVSLSESRLSLRVSSLSQSLVSLSESRLSLRVSLSRKNIF